MRLAPGSNLDDFSLGRRGSQW